MSLGISSFTMKSGERACLIMDHETGLPLYYPNLFLTTQIRNRSSAYSTVEAAASNLIVLIRFLKQREIDLEQRLLKRLFFKPHELDDLRDFAQLKLRRRPIKPHLLMMFDEEDLIDTADIVNNGTHYSRLTTIATYISWLAMHYCTSQEASVYEQIHDMEQKIKDRRPRKKGRSGHGKDLSLKDGQIDALFEVIRPDSRRNPFKEHVKRRNRLIILLLYHLGIRGGELLNIRICDINFSTNQLSIVRRADEASDVRTREPNAKTLGRDLPLHDNLVKELHDYIVKERRNVSKRLTHDYLIVTHKEGKTCGLPISKSAYNEVISIVRSIAPELYQMTGHKLRHTWNRRFSEKMDNMDNPPSQELQEKIRSYLMGWKEGSGTAATYNKRFVAQKGMEAALYLQETNNFRSPSAEYEEQK